MHSFVALAIAAASVAKAQSLDSNVLCKGCTQTGIGANGSEAGEVPSLTSNENFINFCVGQDNGPSNKPITNGIQITSGSCNPVPMGAIAATTNMPSSKFVQPKNLDTVPANQNFTVNMAIANLQTGNFVNADTNYYSAPCFLNSQGDIVGHSHVVIQQIDSLQSTSLTDNTKFAFFKGLDDAAQNGILSVTVSPGLAAGTYRMGSINTCANHQPALVAVAQHANLDDIIYFTASDGGSGGGNNDAAQASQTAASSAAAASASATSTSGQQQQGGGFDGHDGDFGGHGDFDGHRVRRQHTTGKKMARLSKRRLDLERSA